MTCAWSDCFVKTFTRPFAYGLTASGSGLDPEISPAAAKLQVPCSSTWPSIQSAVDGAAATGGGG